MAELPSDLLEDVGKARVGGGGNYIQHGDYILMINKWFFQKIQDRCIILECLVIEARKKIVYEGSKPVEQEPNKPGSSCSSTANFDSEAKLSAPANSRAPVLGLYGFKEGSVDDAKVKTALSRATSDAQPMHGMLVAVSTFPKEIRSKRGEYITGLDWSCVAVPGTGVNAADKVAARAAALKVSPEKCLEVALAQLSEARANGTGAQLPANDTGSQPIQSTTTTTTAPTSTGGAPEIPGVPGVPELPAAKDPLEGWTVHPNDPSWYYRGKEIKKKDDLIAGR